MTPRAAARLSIARQKARARAIAACAGEQTLLKDEYLERQRAREQARASAPGVPRPPMLR